MKIRLANTVDAPSIAELMGELGYPGTPAQIANRLSKVFEIGELVFVAEKEGQIAGMICYSSRPHLASDNDAGRITSLVVKTAFRRSGVGRALVEYVEETARELGHGGIELTTRIHRKEAHSFYLSLNYQETSKKFFKKLD